MPFPQPQPLRRHIAAAALLLLGLGLAAPLAAQPGSIKQLEKELEEKRAEAAQLRAAAAALAAEVEALRDKSIAAARRAQGLESEVTATEQTLEDLKADEQAKTADLADRREQLGRTLGALQRLALEPPEAALVRNQRPVDSARAALLLQVAIPALEARATQVREELGDLALLRTRIARERDGLAAAAASLNGERARLSALLARKAELQSATEAEREATEARIARLAEEAHDLRELTQRLEAERLAAEQRALEQAREAAAREAAAREAATREAVEQAARENSLPSIEKQAQQIARLAPPTSLRPFPEAEASLTMPVRGQVVRLYGQNSQAQGSTDKGISIQTRAGAQVVAPFDGRIAYAGPFRGYGLILIIEHGGRYHTILAGFNRVDAVVGQWVLAGEPIARMGDAAGGNPELYFELRRTGQAINPLPWLATTNDKVRG